MLVRALLITVHGRLPQDCFPFLNTGMHPFCKSIISTRTLSRKSLNRILANNSRTRTSHVDYNEYKVNSRAVIS